LTDKEYIQSLTAINLQQAQQIKSLEEKVAVLLKQIQEMGIKKDSHNSSMAPSTDIFKKNQSLRPKSNLKSGGQPGHKGSTLEMNSTPEEIIELKSNYCNSCGADLKTETFVLQSKRQVINLPPITPIYTEYQQFSCKCSGCGHKQTTNFPSQVTAPIQYGSTVETLVSYLSVYQSVPYNRLKMMFSQVFSLPLSEGTVDNILQRVALKCEVVYEHIKAEISSDTVVGSDETGAKVNGKKWWIWVWQSIQNTFIVASDNRGFKTIEAFFAQGFPNATLISDRWAAQLKIFSKGKQLCLAHLLRELVYLIESEKNGFSAEFKTLIGTVFDLKKQQIIDKKATSVNDPKAILIENKLNELLAMVIDAEKYPKTAIFQLSMIKYRNYLLPCIYDLAIPADNNASERAIRIIKVKQKVSGQFKTGQHAFCVIRSVIDTLIKRNLEVISHLNQIIKLQPE
jgi:transposase